MASLAAPAVAKAWVVALAMMVGVVVAGSECAVVVLLDVDCLP